MTDPRSSPAERTVVGLCGCGNMGSAIASRLSETQDVVLYDAKPGQAGKVVAEIGRPGVTEAASLEELAGRVRHVVLSLPTAAASAAVVAELSRVLAPGSVIIETSTVTPTDIAAAAELCESRAVELIDAAVLSGVAQMRSGSSMLLIGGEDRAVAVGQPVLDALAQRQVRLGGLGTGMAVKVANNAVSHAVMVVLLEAAAMAQSWGVSAELFSELLLAEDAGLLRPLTHRFRERVLSGDYEGGMPTEAARKDSVLALRMAQEGGVPLFAIQGAHSAYELAVRAGLARQDYAALGQLWEQWTGRRFGAREL
jgi:3-hydroxyisobutyrate dehydrogenase-like beta-hydroxyacid dehydrogenase